MFSRLTTGILGLLLSVLNAVPASAQTGEPSEIQSFWQSPSEQAALDEIRTAFSARGGVWVDFQTRNSVDNRTLAFQRIIRGVPPFAIQWFGGRDLRAMSESGVIHDLTSIAAASNWSARLNAEVLKYITVGSTVYGLPIGVHSENWSWFNKKVLRQIGAPVPQSWEEVFDLLSKARKLGIDGIAIGQHNWERSLIFNSILTSEGGSNLYRRLMEQADLSVLDDPIYQRAFGLFSILRQFDPRDSSVADWNEATEKLAAGRVVVQFMGDWVLPELAFLGLKAGEDFECEISLGKIKRPAPVIDIMIFPIGHSHTLTAEHQRMVEAVLDPNTQLAFSNAKGAIPVLANMASDITNICTQKAYDLMNSSDTAFAAVTIVDERIGAILDQILNDLWRNNIATPEEAIARLKHDLKTR